ncbi:transposase [Rubrobacter xylanophilus]|uniref:transposase n=1 Tax=Rubrobacter xylanophilus TaxID=49319 RepID=UPI0038CD22E3
MLADRGFRRASFIRWLQEHSLNYVVRIKKGACLTEKDGRRWIAWRGGIEARRVAVL